jgi:hypothetical protein
MLCDKSEQTTNEKIVDLYQFLSVDEAMMVYVIGVSFTQK